MTQQPRAALVYNPVKIDLPRVRRALETLEAELGYGETLLLETSVEDPGQGPAREALEAGVDVVIAAGGDGTVRAVAEALRGSGTSLGLLPSGTGNLLARNLGLGLADVTRALRIALTGTDRAIDAAVMELRAADGGSSEHTFVVMAGMGLDARMLSETDDDLKKRAGWLAYVQAIVRVVKDPNVLRFSFRLDDNEPRRVKAHTIIVGNCGTLPANILLLPDAAVDDGVLDIVVLRPETALGWVQALTKIIWENGIVRRLPRGDRAPRAKVDALVYSTGTDLDLRLTEPADVELDGDPFGRAVGFRVRVDPGSLLVRVPE
ncbi:diacylglycerol/lipid kinase family protein [Litorihabitans aurantiacus]|uniref:Sphingosine kinase n=1 Tax=Litorihabitans aurantiacus TaxID=1930061 RepID=A0AA37USQ6_9MICO|nr:diacylglycerol kinase family protein [Litorihabitans aurantiacus]GMA30102.1 sphingosine kinase [Litorihabitans aurantiacus]